MIRSFRGLEAARIWRGEVGRRLPRDIQDRALRKLRQIHAAASLDDLRNPPGNRLEALKADRQGQWSVRVNDQWRICFEWDRGDAFEVDIVDYH
ncbi:MAG: type II toxin-antitoxin system RelE/ParE family toxin [Alphaproteobacteria bacterium]|nr:type II toxin-antitoxin system RelE/ParE family toxin [Alphaproteobacteria bacterium]